MVLASLVRVFLAHPDMEEAVHAKQDRENMPSISGLSSSSSKATRIITKAPYSWPHLTLITSQRLCLKNTTLNFSIKFVTHTHCGNAFKPSRALLELTDWQNTRIPHKSFRALMEPPSLLIGHDHWWLEILDSGGEDRHRACTQIPRCLFSPALLCMFTSTDAILPMWYSTYTRSALPLWDALVWTVSPQ